MKKKNRSLRYATAGRAAFDAKKNTIRLTEFPQAYQDDDTVTGEIMIFHRNSELIEIEQSNSINQGN
jgi:lipopolysaccharide export system protein LptA